MSHFIIASEGYRKDLDKMVNAMEKKRYSCKMPDNKINYVTPAFREIRLFDVVIQDQLENELLLDLGAGQNNAKRFKSIVLRAWSFILKSFNPLGFTYANLEASREKANECYKVKNFLVAKRKDKTIFFDGHEYELL